MPSPTPLMASWTLEGEHLPPRLLPEPAAPAFTLPGAQDLSAFADLLGDAPQPAVPAEPARAPFRLPALIPEDMPGQATLACVIDFGRLCADRVLATFDLLVGRGEAFLEDCPAKYAVLAKQPPQRLCAFDHQPVTLDLSDALRRRRQQRLVLRFDDTRPAGVCGAVMLRLVRGAMLENVTIHVDGAWRTMSVRADVRAIHPGEYVLHAQLCPPDATQEPSIAREVSCAMRADGTRRLQMTMDLPGEPFIPGKPYAAPAMRVELRTASGMLADSALLLCGYPGKPASGVLPLCASACTQPPGPLVDRLREMHIPAVSLPIEAPHVLYRELTRAGIGVRQFYGGDTALRERLERFPCVTFDETFTPCDEAAPDPALNAWQMCAAVAYPRPADPGMIAADYLAEAAGRIIDPSDENVQAVLEWLRAVTIRLRAEAVRQGLSTLPLCAPGEWEKPDVAAALQTAFTPLHLSAAPLYGAWWTGSRMSATLRAFIPQERQTDGLRAVAVLEDDTERELARMDVPCPRGGHLGMIEAVLPETPCVLELTTRLYDGETLIEESTLPVYVGERGPLEAAF